MTKPLRIKNGTVKSVDVGDGSLTGTDIKNSSIANADVAVGYYTRAQVDAKTPAKTVELNIPGRAFRATTPVTPSPTRTGALATSRAR